MTSVNELVATANRVKLHRENPELCSFGAWIVQCLKIRADFGETSMMLQKHDGTWRAAPRIFASLDVYSKKVSLDFTTEQILQAIQAHLLGFNDDMVDLIDDQYVITLPHR